MNAFRRRSHRRGGPQVVAAGVLAAATPLYVAEAWGAAVPVVESEGREIRPQADQPTIQTDGSADPGSAVNTMYYEFQIVQDEVRRLYGVVEELNHRVERLEREQRERYIELDQRLLELRSGPGKVAEGNGDADSPSASPAVPVTEREAYNLAIELVNAARPLPLSERQPRYRRALGLFRDVVKDFPNGEFTANAFYWMGEMHLAMGDPENARAMFTQVDLLYDDHPKVPDALYKLGEVYNVLGDTESAREHLNRVIGDYPASTAAGLAQKLLPELR